MRLDNRVHMALTAALPWRRPRIGRANVLWNQFGETPCAVLTLYLVSLRTWRWVLISSSWTPSQVERIMHWDGIIWL
jgi:hypothetical protein